MFYRYSVLVKSFPVRLSALLRTGKEFPRMAARRLCSSWDVMATILCIDQPEALITRRLVLEKNRYKVQTAHTQDEALEVLRQHAVHCVLARHDPPLMDGLQAVVAIRQFLPRFPIVLLTGVPPHDASSLADECLSSLDGPEEMIRAIARALKKRKSRERLDGNLQQSMRLLKQFKELEKKTVEVMRRILTQD